MEVQWLEVGIPLVVMLVPGQMELLMVCWLGNLPHWPDVPWKTDMSAEQVQLSHAGRSVENLAIVLQLQRRCITPVICRNGGFNTVGKVP